MEPNLTDRVAYCGLICEWDSCYADCGGCKVPGSTCGYRDCPQKACCIEKSLVGCWECDRFPCGKGLLSNTNPSRGQIAGYIRAIRQVGLETYMTNVRANSSKGIRYGLGGDYADKPEADVLEMLNGKR